MTGAIVGGWGWVAAAWGFSLSVLCVYTIWLAIQLRKQQAAARAHVEPEPVAERSA